MQAKLNRDWQAEQVLIETYWNVNDAIWAERTFRTRINRNILECKCKKQMHSNKQLQVLIETYWNVNFCTTATI